jgi:osmotically-inducible protein OsmY
MTTLEKNQLHRDVQLEKAVDDAISGEGRIYQVVSVAKNGYVRLVGHVEGLEVKKKIEAAVQSVPGVRMVTNHLKTHPRRGLEPAIHF